MKELGITRYFTVFGAGFLGPEEKIPVDWDDAGQSEEMKAINMIRRDMRRVWDLILKAKLNYTIWCPANFPSGPRSSDYKESKNEFIGPEVTTGMVADSIVKELKNNQYEHTRVGICKN